MIHLGDIAKISGRTAPVVDVAIGGSPCQDLSVAGQRAGLAGSRSGLFMEQIRIVKEMREEDRRRGRADNAIRPRFMVWENVPGAFSSNGGRDFQAVLSEIIRVAEPDAPDVPLPPKGRWPLADAYYGDGWSLAYRVLDAQFWGVPQRRRRIVLVADFGGHAAPEILFERQGVSRDLDEGKPQGEVAAADSGVGAEIAVGFPLGFRAENTKTYNETATTICSGTRPGFCNGVICMATQQGEIAFRQHKFGEYREGIGTITCGHGARHTGETLIVAAVDCRNGAIDPDVNGTLQAKSSGGQSLNLNNVVLVAVPGEPTSFDLAQVTNQTNQSKGSVGTAYSLTSTGRPAIITTAEDGTILLDGQPCTAVKLLARRLTPLECERLQGYPEGWTALPEIQDMTDEAYVFWRSLLLDKAIREGKVRTTDAGAHEIWRKVKAQNDEGETEEAWENTHRPYKHKTKEQMVRWYNKSFVFDTDSARYMALGNSIALPPWKWVLKRISAQYERDATMASLFDGIGGFPLLWEQINGKGSCLWASEIEPFPVAVTRYHFGEEG